MLNNPLKLKIKKELITMSSRIDSLLGTLDNMEDSEGELLLNHLVEQGNNMV